MRVYLIKVGCMNYGICVSDSEDKVKNYYTLNHPNLNFSIEDISHLKDLPVLEVVITKELKTLIK